MIWFQKTFLLPGLTWAFSLSDCYELIDLLITAWIQLCRCYPPLLWMFFACSSVIEFLGPTKIGNWIVKYFPFHQKAPHWAVTAPFYRSVITPWHQYFRGLCCWGSEVDPPGLEARLYWLVAVWPWGIICTLRASVFCWNIVQIIGLLGKLNVLIHKSI